MKEKFIKFIEKPKLVIVFTLVLSIIAGVFIYIFVGNAPDVSWDKEENNITFGVGEYKEGDDITLAFPKSGRVGDVYVKVGDIVKKGDKIANLDFIDAEGLVNQTKGALDLAEAEYSSLNLQYKNVKKQQDMIVNNAYQTMLSSGLEGIPSEQDLNSPIISGNYICGKEGSYIISPYQSSDSDTGLSFNYTGIETGVASVKYDNPIPLGTCGLQIKFKNISYFKQNVKWTIDIPNKKSAVYLSNKNAYELAVDNRDKILSELSKTIGSDTGETSVAKAKIAQAKGAYQVAIGAYNNNFIYAPEDGVITFVNIKKGEIASMNQKVVGMIVKK